MNPFNHSSSIHSFHVETDTNTNFETDNFNNEPTNDFEDNQFYEYDTDIENFFDQIDDENKNRATPLYRNSPISLYDVCVKLIGLASMLNLDKKKSSILLKELQQFFPDDSRLPKTIFMLLKITNNNQRPQVRLQCI